LLASRGRFAFDHEVDRLSRVEQIVGFLALLELRKREEARIAQAGPFEPITVWNASAS
jgi:chromatin segregation and condensation protein Rec8/ScpA/Scc1 (kleisin family)